MDTEVTVELRGKNLLFAVPTFDGNMPAEWMMAYMVTAQELGAAGVGCGLNVRSGSSLIPKCRDEIIHQFLFNEEMQPFDYMLCIDADVIWNPADIPVSYTHLTLPTTGHECRSRWSPYH